MSRDSYDWKDYYCEGRFKLSIAEFHAVSYSYLFCDKYKSLKIGAPFCMFTYPNTRVLQQLLQIVISSLMQLSLIHSMQAANNVDSNSLQKCMKASMPFDNYCTPPGENIYKQLHQGKVQKKKIEKKNNKCQFYVCMCSRKW